MKFSASLKFPHLLSPSQTLGNPEFDYGPDVLLSYLSHVTFPIVTCNVVPSPNSVLHGILKPGPLIIRVPQEGGRSVRVGIVGWTTLDTIVSASPGPDVAVLPSYPFWVPTEYRPAHRVPYVQAFVGGR